jgi:hypothetical protein
LQKFESLCLTCSSAIASPIATSEKGKFVIGVTFNNTVTNNGVNTTVLETLFLTSTSIASTNLADGIQCTIESDKLACGPDMKTTFTYSAAHTMSPLQPVAYKDTMNKAWSIGADNKIQWGAVAYKTGEVVPNIFVTFSREKGKDANKIFAEACTSFDHHKQPETEKLFGKDIINFWQKGEAKAYYVTK